MSGLAGSARWLRPDAGRPFVGPVEPQLLDIDQLAELLGTSHRHIRRLIAEKRIPYVKVGRLIRFDPGEIAAWLDQTRQPVGGYACRH